MDKFASSTSLWQILRGFESATAGGLGTQKNFTGRGVPSMVAGNSGAGRLYYEEPVLRIMGREYSSLTDLQKSLGQLGYNGGSVLLHLTFRTSELPLEQAQKEIEDYFKSLEDGDTNGQGAHSGAVGSEVSAPDVAQTIVPEEIQESRTPEAKSPIEPTAAHRPAPTSGKNENLSGSFATSTREENQESMTDQAPASFTSSDHSPDKRVSDLQENAGATNDNVAATNGEKRKASTSLAPEPTSKTQSEDGILPQVTVSTNGKRT